jgi:hypothetical protein
MSKSTLIASTPREFQLTYANLAGWLLMEEPFDRGEVHAQKVVDPLMATIELQDVVIDVKVPEDISEWAAIVDCNQPWAENHFQERVGGVPLNPPPEEANWPYAQQGNAAHKKDEKFSHTYPERFWPVHAGFPHPEREKTATHWGIRFKYGDLNDLIQVLVKNPRSRQAYLPVWFPEDLTAARRGERVPCTLGYHFMLHPDGKLHCTYHMRSCDIVRFFKDDVYMAGRLLQWVCNQLNQAYGPKNPEAGAQAEGYAKPGKLRLTISSLHCFVGDKMLLTQMASTRPSDIRASYNFEALG